MTRKFVFEEAFGTCVDDGADDDLYNMKLEEAAMIIIEIRKGFI